MKSRVDIISMQTLQNCQVSKHMWSHFLVLFLLLLFAHEISQSVEKIGRKFSYMNACMSWLVSRCTKCMKFWLQLWNLE